MDPCFLNNMPSSFLQVRKLGGKKSKSLVYQMFIFSTYCVIGTQLKSSYFAALWVLKILSIHIKRNFQPCALRKLTLKNSSKHLIYCNKYAIFLKQTLNCIRILKCTTYNFTKSVLTLERGTKTDIVDTTKKITSGIDFPSCHLSLP